MGLIPRAVRPTVDVILGDTRAAAILGPRQVGKSTLARELLGDGGFRSYVTLDDGAARDLALRDPDGFVAGLERPAVIDEIQRAPDVLLAIKAVVDRDTAPGQFLLTGSANVRAQRRVADALPGRVEYVRLWPFAQSELHGLRTTLVDRLLAGDPPRLSEQDVGLAAYADVIVRGGFPDARTRSDSRRGGYFRDYVDTILGRDIPDVAGTRVDPVAVTRLLRVLATRSSNTANFENLARDLQISPNTARAYVELLEQLFVVHRLRPWARNLGSREIKTPKLFLTDSGLCCSLVGATAARLLADGDLAGKAVETFVFNELLRQSGWAAADVAGLHFYRDRDRREVDVVIETFDGRVVAFETKAAARVERSDESGLRFLRDQLGERFVGGAVLYTGRTTLELSDRVWAIPLSGLWAA